ncbi:MAG: hypothetical protein ACM3PY_10100, partial [Omnitrophica WOR_2 bacterium]
TAAYHNVRQHRILLSPTLRHVSILPGDLVKCINCFRVRLLILYKDNRLIGAGVFVGKLFDYRTGSPAVTSVYIEILHEDSQARSGRRS